MVCKEWTGLMEMTQVDITDRVIKALVLDDVITNIKFTPSGSKPLVDYADGSAPCGTFSYSSMVGMFLYISGHTRP